MRYWRGENREGRGREGELKLAHRTRRGQQGVTGGDRREAEVFFFCVWEEGGRGVVVQN